MSKQKEMMRGKDKIPASGKDGGRKQALSKPEDRPKKQEGKARLESKPQPSRFTYVYPSKTNREREMKRIDKENQALKKRLEETKATKPVRRTELLKYYEQQAKYRGPPAPPPTMKVSPPIVPYTRKSL